MSKSYIGNPYIMNLDKEFYDATHRYDDDSFQNWLKSKNENLKLYYDFLLKLGLNKDKQIIELEKGKYDTLANVIPAEQHLLEISNYVETIDSTNIEKIKGNLIVEDGLIKIKKDNIKKLYSLKEQQYCTQFPINYDSLKIMRYLTFINEQIYIGAYGNQNDYNRRKVIRQLQQFSRDLKLCGIETNIDSKFTKNQYVYIIKNKK